MFGKLLLGAALCFATLSHGVRRNFEVGSVARAFQDASVLIQEHAALVGSQSAMQIMQNAEKAIQGITPGASGAMSAVLQSVVSDLEDKVQNKIKADHKATQIAINEMLDALIEITNKTVEAKTAADAADTVFVECRSVERTRLQEWEFAKAARTAAEEAMVAPCNEQVAAAPYSQQVADQDFVFDCDISIAGSCNGVLADFETRVDGLLSDLGEDVSAKTLIFEDARKRCDASKAALVAAVEEDTQAWDAFQLQKEQCIRTHEHRQVTACVFGGLLTRKCTARSEFKALDVKIESSGSVHSKSDRMAEWEATAVTRCMLNLLVGSEDLVNLNIDKNSLSTCVSAVNFARDVGVLDRKQDEFAALVTPEKFTCTETEITFSGFTWKAPEATTSEADVAFIKQQSPSVPAHQRFRPSGQGCSGYEGTLSGEPLHRSPHTITMALWFNPKAKHTSREWLLNVGQTGKGAHHWLWSPGGIQFGMWNGGQIGDRKFSSASTLVTVFDGQNYKLYIDGQYVAAKEISLDITSQVVAIGSAGYGVEHEFSGCVGGVDVYREALTESQVKASLAELEANVKDWRAITSNVGFTGRVTSDRYEKVKFAVPVSATNEAKFDFCAEESP